MKTSTRQLLPLMVLLLTLQPSRARAFEGIELDLGLYNRLTVKANHVERMLRYSTADRTFDVGSYLAPRTDEISYSLFARASLHLEATSWLSFGLSVDSGLLNPTGRVPRTAEVQLSSVTYKGITLPGYTVPVTTTENDRKVTANGQPIKDEATESFFVRQAFVRLSAPETGWLSVTLGRQAMEVGGGLIYNDHGLGAALLLDFEALRDKPVRVGLKVLLPTRAWDEGLRSPLVELRVDYVFSSFLSLVESVGLSVAFFHDGDDNISRLLDSTISEAVVQYYPDVNQDLVNYAAAGALAYAPWSKANIVWIGLSGRKLLGDLMLSANLQLEVGKLKLENPFWALTGGATALPSFLPQDEVLELSCLGFAGELTASYLISESLSFGGFFLFLSGGDNPYAPGQAQQRYGSFISVMPYITHTNLFFSGGMNETFSGRQATTAGINGRGVIAFGPNVAWEITDGLDAGATAALLFSPVESLAGGNFYGFEVDLEASYQVLDWLKLSTQYDMLVAGNFFPQKSVIHQFLLGVDVTYER